MPSIAAAKPSVRARKKMTGSRPMRGSICSPRGAESSINSPRGESCTTMRFRKLDRKSTRLNSSHGYISYAVFCLKKKIATTTGAAPDDAGHGHAVADQVGDRAAERAPQH